MALNEMIAQGAQFNMPDPVAQYNKLAQMQQYQSQNELNRQEALDKATERQRVVSERTKRSAFLTQFGEKLAERGVELNKKTVAGMISSGVPEIEKLGFEALKAMQSDESYNAAMGGAPAAATPMAAGPQVQLPSDLTATPAPVANTMTLQAPAATVTNATIAPAPAAPPPTPAVAPASKLQDLIDQRNRVQRIRPQTPDDVARIKNTLDGIDKQIEVLNRQDPDPVRIARAIAATIAPPGTPENLAAYNKTLKEQSDKSKAEIVKVIGVATGTKNPVYLDVNTDEQYTYVTGTDGKQTRKLYSGGVDRSTSNVSQNVSNKVDTFVPASETAQKEFMQETRVTYNALKNAQPTLDNIEAAKALVPTAKGFMGTGGEPLLLAASFLNNRLGTKIDTKGVTDASELRSRLFFGILDNLKKLDSQPSQAQQAVMQEALGNLGTDPNALGRVLDAFGDSIRTKVDLHNIEVSNAETRGVKFPYSAKITLKPKIPGAAATHPFDIQAIIDAQKRK